MPHPIAYLSFNGHCAEAMRFYEQALGGKLEAMIAYRQTPYAEQTRKEHLDRIMHAHLALPGGGSLYAGDTLPEASYSGIQGVMIAITYDTVAEAEKVFEALSVGAKVSMPPDKLFRAWTEPALLVQWFAPLPWTVPHAELDVRPGGSSRVVMRGPDGTEFPSEGIYLEVVPNRKLVFTDAYVRAWEPSAKPFMTATITFDDLGNGKTRYTARVAHWSAADKAAHEAMGFHSGWGQCTDQLAALAQTL